MTALVLYRPLGRYPPRAGYEQLEFQIGRTLIWVMRPLAVPENECVCLAQQQLPELWTQANSAFDVAVRRLRGVRLTGDLVGRSLRLMSISIWPEDGSANYDIEVGEDYGEWNNDQEIAVVLPPGLEHETLVSVRREPNGSFQTRD